MNKPKVFMTSDLHFCHDREFLYKPRGFDTIWEMNEAIVNNWNSVVDMGDQIYVLGDLMLNDNDTGIKLIKQLKGDIHIVRGNHDTDTRMQLYNDCYNVVEITEGQFLKYGKYHFYLSHYPCLTSNMDMDKPLKARTVSLCGHSHTKNKFKDMDKGLIFHVELDTNNCHLWLLDDIIKELKNYKKEPV